MDSKFLSVCRAVVMLLLLAKVAAAGPLPTDVNAYIRGTLTVSGAAGAKTLNSTIDYAVFAPHQFNLSAMLNFPYNSPQSVAAADITAGNNYVYAYEINNTGSGTTANITNFSLGLAWQFRPTSIPNGWTEVGYSVGQDGTGASVKAPTNSPNFKFFQTTYPYHNVIWRFDSSSFIGTNQHSEILIFTSPYYAHYTASSIQASGITFANLMLPTPVPEPTTVAMAGIGLACLLGAKFARRRRA